MAIKFDTFKVASGGAGTDNLDDVTSRGSTTTNSITVGGVTVGTEYSLPSTDGSANQVISTNGSGTLTFTTLDFTGGLEYKGSYDITAAPSLTSAKKGDFYIITNGPGTIASVSFEDGDHIVFNQDASSPLTSAMFDKIDNSEAYTTLASLTDTNISSPANGQVLKHNGTNWVNTQLAYSELSGTPTNVSTFTNDANYVASGDNVSVLTNDAGYLTDITGENLSDLSDVTISTPSSGQVLSYNGTNWVNAATSGGATALNDLTDVTITAAANGDYLRYNGSAWVDATLAVVDDTTPSLGGDLDVNGNSITSSANGDVTINPDGTGSIAIGADVIPDADITHTLGSEDFRYITTYSDLNGAIRFKAKNDEGSAITAGQVLYIKGLAGDGETPTVGLADADDASKMPAFGLAYAGANDQAEVQVVSFGNLYNVNTSSFSVGDTLYVSTTSGALTNTKPTGETSQLQNIGRVVRSDASAGVITVGGAGRSAATPNLNDGYFFLGNASNQSVSTQLSSINVSTFVNNANYVASGDNVSTLTNDAGYLTDITGENLGDLSDVTVTTPTSGQVLSYNGANWVNSAASSGSLAGLSDTTITGPANGEVLKYNGSSWVDVQLAYSELSGTPTNVSTFTNDAGYLTNINSESLGDLSDVTITAAASGEVIRYNGSAWVDAQLAYSDLSGTPTNVSTFTNDAGYLTDITGENLSDLSDVTVTTPTSGQVLSYNGTNWVNAAASGGGGSVPAVTSATPSSDYTISTTSGIEEIYLLNPSVSINVNLPSAATASSGYKYTIKNLSNTYSLTVDPNSTETIDGSGTYQLNVHYQSLTIVSDGTNWHII